MNRRDGDCDTTPAKAGPVRPARPHLKVDRGAGTHHQSPLGVQPCRGICPARLARRKDRRSRHGKVPGDDPVVTGRIWQPRDRRCTRHQTNSRRQRGLRASARRSRSQNGYRIRRSDTPVGERGGRAPSQKHHGTTGRRPYPIRPWPASHPLILPRSALRGRPRRLPGEVSLPCSGAASRFCKGGLAAGLDHRA